ncbi:flagellar hook-basal body protein [Virgibacillus halodenitrificans]|uniref:Flagellar hook-basal body protein n=1 Tax=Virgibacillus halodenitrificans TaxID=1482 RepID=A0AAC9NMI2_VIRHA|nr:flagellar hook-basal body protein [Virgibacillus halodenitrificans]APC49721.1 flagellar hook-basal body protein [Virgibacillus halodenitrificans]CDQ31520.1 Distal rod protein [Virgibacillus halodenitrificans]
MSRTMIQAAVTMNQLQSKLDLIGNNMANSETTGYKNRSADFSSLLFQQIDNLKDEANAVGRLTPEGVRIGSGAKLGTPSFDLNQGSITETGRTLDAALLRENHFFQVQVTENGIVETQYTRDGAFYLSPINNNEDVMLTDKNGNPIIGENGSIVIPAGFDSIDIHPNGQVSVKRGDQTEIAGNITVVEAVRPRLLEATGNNSFRLPANMAELGYQPFEVMQGVEPGTEIIKNGALERSNVDISKEMTDLIMTQRSYQFNARTISMSDQMMGLINQVR